MEDNEIDDFERWIEAEFETPAQVAINKVIRDEPLNKSDWDKLAMYLASQDVRTPISYLESKERWEKTLPEILNQTLKRAVVELAQAKKKGEQIKPTKSNDAHSLGQSVKVSIEPDTEPGMAVIRASMKPDRRLWLASQRFLLSKTATALLKHKWSIVKPAAGNEWFTCDHPVIRLNYYEDGTYDLRGGWGNRGANVMMPLSPQHLLFAEIGSDLPDSFTFSDEKTAQIQAFFAERAFRLIFSRHPVIKISQFRPRHVNAEAYKYEQEQWSNWHKIQSEI